MGTIGTGILIVALVGAIAPVEHSDAGAKVPSRAVLNRSAGVADQPIACGARHAGVSPLRGGACIARSTRRVVDTICQTHTEVLMTGRSTRTVVRFITQNGAVSIAPSSHIDANPVFSTSALVNRKTGISNLTRTGRARQAYIIATKIDAKILVTAVVTIVTTFQTQAATLHRNAHIAFTAFDVFFALRCAISTVEIQGDDTESSKAPTAVLLGLTLVSCLPLSNGARKAGVLPKYVPKTTLVALSTIVIVGACW